MPIIGGQDGIALEISVQQARRFNASVPDGRISSRELRNLQDPADLSAQGARLAAERDALGAARESVQGGNALLGVAETGFDRVEQLLDRLKDLAVRAASPDLSDAERGILNEDFQNALAELDTIANDTAFNGQTLLDAELDRLVPVGTTQLTGVETVDGGTGTFTVSNSISGTGVRNLRTTGATLAPPTTVVNNGFTFPDVRRFDLTVQATSTSAGGTIGLQNVQVQTNDGGTTTVGFTGQLADFTAITRNTGTSPVQINATTITTLTLQATNTAVANNALLDVTENFSVSVSTPSSTATAAFLSRETTSFDIKAGTGTDPQADEISVSVGGLTPGGLALRDVSLRGDRETNRAERLVEEAQLEANGARATLEGDRDRLSAGEQTADRQRDGLISAREAINDVPETQDVSREVADNIVSEFQLAIGIFGGRLSQNSLERFF